MLKLTTFGGLSLSRDGQPLAGAAAQRSRLALLALLASAGPAGISRDKLLLFLWPESDSERARHALKQAVYALRRDLGDDEAIQGTNALTLNPTLFESDVREFEAAMARGDFEAATALYTGPFLDGVYLKDAPEFERWCADQRTRLSQSWSRAVEQLAKRAEAAGDWEGAVTRWRQLAAAEPLSGRIACSLMRALAESGDVAAALQHYRVHETMVREDMDTPPDKDVVALADSLKAGTWVRSAPRVSAPREPVADARDPAGGRTTNEVDARSSRETPVVGVEAVAASLPPATPPAHHSRAGRRIGALVAIAVVALGVLTASTRYWMTHRSLPRDAKLILVAPLENNTTDSTLRGLGTMSSQWLAEALRELGFRVFDSWTAMAAARRISATACASQQLTDPGCAVELAERTGAQQVIAGAYYVVNDSLRISVQITDAVDPRQSSSITVVGRRTDQTRILTELVARVEAALVSSTDKRPYANTVRLVPPPTVEASEHVTRGWQLFFANPYDTTAVFTEFDRALASDSSYLLPWIFRAYIYDVKQQWPQLEEVMTKLRPKSGPLGMEPRTAMEMFEADLAGKLYDRLSISHTLMERIPRSTEFVLLVVLSSLYVGQPAGAVAALAETAPDSGMNLTTAVYWQWRGVAQHFNGNYADEAASVTEGVKRFPTAPMLTEAQVRVLARSGDVAGITALLESDRPGTRDSVARQALTLFAARELRAHDHPAEAKALLDRLAASVRNVPLTAPIPALRRKGEIMHEAGDYEASAAVFGALMRRDPSDVAARGRLGAAAARRGDQTRAAQIDSSLAALRTKYLFGANTMWRAHIAAAGGRHEDAANLLSQAMNEGYRLIDIIPYTPHDDGDFVEFRASPSYTRMMKRLAEHRIP